MSKFRTKLMYALSLILFLGGCTSEDADPIDENYVSFRGTIVPSTTTKSLKSENTYQIEIIYNKPIRWESLLQSFAVNVEHKTVNADDNGYFAFQVERGKKFIAFLVDASQEYRKAIGVIGIGTGDNEYWENIDTQYAQGIISLGNIPTIATNNVLPSQNDINTIGLSGSDLQIVEQLSHLDNSVRFYKNFINAGFENLTGPSFTYTYPELEDNSWTPGDQISYAGYQTYLWGKFLGETTTMTPPSCVTTGEGTSYDSENPIDGYFFGTDQDGNALYNFITGEGDMLLGGNPPQGYWTLKADQVITHQYDYGCIHPIKDGQISNPLPLIKINSQDNQIASLQVKWVVRNSSGVFEEIDPQILEKVFPGFYLEIADHSSEEEFVEDRAVEIATSTIDLNNSWSTTNDGVSHFAEYIGITYIIDGVFHRFVLRKDN